MTVKIRVDGGPDLRISLTVAGGKLTDSTIAEIHRRVAELHRRARRLLFFKIEADVQNAHAPSIKISAWGKDVTELKDTVAFDPISIGQASDKSVLLAVQKAIDNIGRPVQETKSKEKQTATAKSLSGRQMITYAAGGVAAIALLVIFIIFVVGKGVEPPGDAAKIEREFELQLEELGFDPDDDSVHIPAELASKWYSKALGTENSVTEMFHHVQYLCLNSNMTRLRLNTTSNRGNGLLWLGDDESGIDYSLAPVVTTKGPITTRPRNTFRGKAAYGGGVDFDVQSKTGDGRGHRP